MNSNIQLSRSWAWLLVTFLTWVIGIRMIRFAIQLTPQSHKRQGILGYAPKFGCFDAGITSFIVGILFSITIGVIIRFLPWWLSKSILLLIGILLILLGLYVIRYV